MRCRKRSILSSTSIDQHLQHIKLNSRVQSRLGSKLLQHSSFPSKPLVTSCKCGASDELQELKAPSHHSLLSRPPLRHYPHLKKPQAFVMREDTLCMSITFKYSNTFKYCMYVVHSNWLSLHKEPEEKKGEVKPGKC